MSLYSLAERHRSGVNDPPAGPIAEAGNIAPMRLLRLRTGIPVIDAATGGGFVQGAVYLIHGAPGEGKSTLIGQAAATIPRSVYVSSEESAEQVAARFVRLGASRQLVGSELEIGAALQAAGSAPLVVIDSISTIKPGIMKAGEAMVAHARRTNSIVITVCHETKIGRHAGPRQLEHLIDCTLALRPGRILVVEKNRFGPAPLAWQLEMTEKGFR